MSQQFSKDVAMDGVRGRGDNIFLGILAGFVAAVLGAVIWMAIESATGFKLGLVAIAIGAMVGFAVRVAGNGRGMIFGIVGAVLTLAGCLGGEVLVIVQQAVSPERDFYTALTTLDWNQAFNNIFGRMDVMSYVIYGIGIYEGFKFSIRK